MRIPSLLVVFAVLGSSAWAQKDGASALAQNDRGHFYFQLNEGILFSQDATDVPGGTITFAPGYAVSLALGYISRRAGASALLRSSSFTTSTSRST
jgi:hypothetical protein